MKTKGLAAILTCCAFSVGVAQAEDWSGFYTGIYAGAGQFGSSGIYAPAPTSGTDLVGGAFAGYAFSVGGIVLGPEVALFGSAKSSSEWSTRYGFLTYYSTDTVDRGALFTLNGRIGVPVGNFLMSLSAGLASSQVSARRVNVDENGIYEPTFNFSGSANYVGYNVAAGVETLLTDNFFLGVELRHVDLGTKRIELDNGGYSNFSVTEQRVGIRLGARFP